MDTKLTLKLDESIIERAKKYASNKKISLSRLIENYLDSITLQDKNTELEISPFVKSISTGKIISDNKDWKELRNDYTEYLDKKYKQMQKIFLDTNIVIDFLGERINFYETSARILTLADNKKIKLFVILNIFFRLIKIAFIYKIFMFFMIKN